MGRELPVYHPPRPPVLVAPAWPTADPESRPDSRLWGAQPLVGFPGSPSCEASSPADSSADAPVPTLAIFCPCTVVRRLALHDPVSLLTRWGSDCPARRPHMCPSPGLTPCSWHSALRLSWTTALQQLPDTDHGGRMKSQMKGVAPTFSRSARLKKREAFKPFTSARASSDTDTADTDRPLAQVSLRDRCTEFPAGSQSLPP